jgi:tellurite resistance protein
MAYAIAKVDGKVQREEREKFHDILSEELGDSGHLFDISDIVFQLFDKDKLDAKTAYEFAMHQVRLNSHYVSPEIKDKFNRVIERVAEAHQPVTSEEREMINQFKKEMEKIKGDPVFF